MAGYLMRKYALQRADWVDMPHQCWIGGGGMIRHIVSFSSVPTILFSHHVSVRAVPVDAHFVNVSLRSQHLWDRAWFQRPNLETLVRIIWAKIAPTSGRAAGALPCLSLHMPHGLEFVCYLGAEIGQFRPISSSVFEIAALKFGPRLTWACHRMNRLGWNGKPYHTG